jgi:hypothetical protein
MMILNEGGNVFGNSDPFDQKIVPSILKFINSGLAGTNIQAIPVGSAATPTPGKMSGDLDVIVDEKSVLDFFNAKDAKTARKALNDYLKSKGMETAQSGINVHVNVPIGQSYHQVDIMVVQNASKVSKFHTHEIPQNSPYKGVNKQLMLAILAKQKGYMWSAWQGLFSRTPEGKKGDFVTDDLDQVAKIIIGQNASASSLGSVEAILKSLPPEESKELLDRARQDPNWVEKEAKPPVGTTEWFSHTRSRLESLDENYVLDEGIGDWIEKKMDQLLGNRPMNKYDSMQAQDAASKAPANLPDDVAEKLVADFLAKKQHQAALERAAMAQRTTVEKLKPYLYYFVGNFIERWKRIPPEQKQRAWKDLALGVFRLLMFILEALAKSKR